MDGNATSVSIDQGVGTARNTGSRRVVPSESATYRLTAAGPGGTATASATVGVIAPPPPVPVVTRFAAEPTPIQRGQSSILRATWDQAHSYCQKIGGRLPTEAEWEYAARAGSTGARYSNLDDIAWYSSNGGRQTHPVGQKQPNAFGLFDMLGNVWQWTGDWYAETYYQASERQDPEGPAAGALRALRGGSWNGSPRSARVGP